MGPDRHYTDPRLAARYDGDNAGMADHDLYLSLARELGTATVLDLGCGTGVFAAACASAGMAAVGVDPASAMLAMARARPGGERVRWIEGYADAIPTGCADFAVMGGHVAQVFLDDAAWSGALAHLHRGLRPGGWLAFETRNPDTSRWRRWTRDNTSGTGVMADGQPFEAWLEVTQIAEATVSFTAHHVVLATGEDLAATSTLRFRTSEQLDASLLAAGFAVERRFGNWDRSPLTPASPEIILVARRLDVAE